MIKKLYQNLIMDLLYRLRDAILKALFDFELIEAHEKIDSEFFFQNVQNEIFEFFKLLKIT